MTFLEFEDDDNDDDGCGGGGAGAGLYHYLKLIPEERTMSLLRSAILNLTSLIPSVLTFLSSQSCFIPSCRNDINQHPFSLLNYTYLHLFLLISFSYFS